MNDLIRNQHPDTRSNKEWLQDMGFLKQVEKRGVRTKPCKHIPDSAIIELANQGMKVVAIAKKLGVSKSTIWRRKHLLENNE